MLRTLSEPLGREERAHHCTDMCGSVSHEGPPVMCHLPLATGPRDLTMAPAPGSGTQWLTAQEEGTEHV